MVSGVTNRGTTLLEAVVLFWSGLGGCRLGLVGAWAKGGLDDGGVVVVFDCKHGIRLKRHRLASNHPQRGIRRWAKKVGGHHDRRQLSLRCGHLPIQASGQADDVVQLFGLSASRRPMDLCAVV